MMKMNKPSLGLYVLIALLFGGIGLHRFYEGRAFSGFMYLLFFWTGVPIILAVFDVIRALTTRRHLYN